MNQAPGLARSCPLPNLELTLGKTVVIISGETVVVLISGRTVVVTGAISLNL